VDLLDRQQPAWSPTFTVVIPTRGRPDGLGRCLAALAAQDYPRACYDVIVVDDGSPESVRPVIDQFRTTLRVDLIEQSNAGPAAARNAGARRATGEFLAFTDDDCVPASSWLTCLARAFETTPGRLIGGSSINRVRDNRFSEVSQQLVSYLYQYYNNGEAGVRFLTSNNMALSAAQFLELGGFSASFSRAAGEDRDFCERWLRRGYAMAYVADATVDHHHMLDLRGFWHQHFNYGRGSHGFHSAHAARGYPPLAVEPMRFYLQLLMYPLSIDRSPRGVALVMLMGVAQIANAAGFFWQAVVARRSRHSTNDS
jgi:glycosyltransferase involved in cell wall biosynthesis